MIVKESVVLGDREFTIEVGQLANQADGAVLVRYGDTMVLVTVCASPERREDINYLPLTCDYQEKTFAAGKIPGGFFKREGRPRDEEVLISRLIDRPIRPLFSPEFRYETQIIATVLSADKENPSDVISITGASCALHLSDIPWQGPVGGVRVGLIDKEFVINPTFEQRNESLIDLVVAGTKDGIVMVEGESFGVPEEIIIDAIFFGHEVIKGLIDLQERLQALVGKEKILLAPVKEDLELKRKIVEMGYNPLRDALRILKKNPRRHEIKKIKETLFSRINPCSLEKEILLSNYIEELIKKIVRERILEEGIRIDGRTAEEIRPITCKVGFLPRAHGSALFTRGETQAIVATTLGTTQDEQKIDALIGEKYKAFMLHYNFPPYCVGEARSLKPPSRREIGHGALAERALAKVIPSQEVFPYTIRVVSEIIESNGSSSMATVCGACLSLMDAGVPIHSPVAGIALGLIKEDSKVAILSDILGDEDHVGDMDFKVAGTKEGITAVQMDIKTQGLNREILTQAFSQAKKGRLFILEKMLETLPEPKKEISPYAPRIFSLKIKPDKIREVIGPGGKIIRGIMDQTGVTIDIEEDGTIFIASPDKDAAKKAMEMVSTLTKEPQVGEIYKGHVRRITDFGAFVEILPGQEGLIHISELSHKRVRRVEDILHEGDNVLVKVVNIDSQGKIKLSRKEAISTEEKNYER